ncbi:MAG: chromosome segregation ATPase [Flavobacteriaceae bacterium]|jgi:chromosome segregation ATPase
MLKRIEIVGFKSFAKKTELTFDSAVTAVVGPNGSGKSNIVEAMRFVLGEQSIKSMRGKDSSDLIFKGSTKLSKSNRASVSIVFDNTKRVFSLPTDDSSISLDFDEVVITRTVYVDGGSEYSICGAGVRLKDVHAMLASVSIGTSGHHIISQGGADRILSAHPRDRREMVEDALALSLYKGKIKDAQRRLKKTEENNKEISLSRRELAPQLRFLRKQVEKIEQAEELRGELGVLYKDYLAQENVRIEHDEKIIRKGESECIQELSILQEKILKLKSSLNAPKESPFDIQIQDIISHEVETRRKLSECIQSIGKEEGKIYALSMVKKVHPQKEVEPMVPFSRIKVFVEDLIKDISSAKDIVLYIQKSWTQFEIRYQKNDAHILEDTEDNHEALEEAKSNLGILQKKKEEHESNLQKFAEEKSQLEEQKRSAFAMSQNNQQELFDLSLKEKGLQNKKEDWGRRAYGIQSSKEDFERELREGRVLIGSEIREFMDILPSFESIVVSDLKEKRIKLERMKIKLEEMGAAGGDDIISEYESVKERDEFLSRELDDITKSITSLHQIISELEVRLKTEFKEGLEKINKQFHEFFVSMFGGGNALLSLVEIKGKKGDDEEIEEGIDVNVSLPNKKSRDLHMLSGGERSLTSIALLFAMSQVEPPPFMVLDETDAALDEANSRRYGDMIEALSKKSRLILVTHNRETMSRAQVLYGVTVSMDGSSKLLSLALEEAVRIAK